MAEEDGEVVGVGDEDLVLDGVGLALDGGNYGAEGVNDVVAVSDMVSGFNFLSKESMRRSVHHGVANPICGQCHVVP